MYSSAGIDVRELMSESDVYRRQILISKVGPCAERVERYSTVYNTRDNGGGGGAQSPAPYIS